jgi:hypothetical protein
MSSHFFPQDDNMAHKRIKIDHANNQLLPFSMSNNHYSTVEQIIADHTYTCKTAVRQERTLIVKNLTR